MSAQSKSDNTKSVLVQQADQWEAQGDPTEVALLAAARKGGLDEAIVSSQLPRLDTLPFDSTNQYMATLHEVGPDRHVIYVKGAFEVLLERCTAALDAAGRPAPLQPDAIDSEVKALAFDGQRVLAFARKELPASATTLEHTDVASDLVFLGLQGMIDPPREEAITAVQACQDAGIRVKMITGDHAFTAAAIATQVGLAQLCPDGTPPPECVLTGRTIADYSDTELIHAADGVAVFARVSPEQKLRLVEALQSHSEVVAMTGDGVNDGPALKQANVGIAMGITGTDVAKEAADVVLTDDNFATIEAAVEEGRGVFDNLTKIIAWVLPTNLGEGMIILLAILAGIALPILPVHILWINTVTTAVLGLSLALERKEPGIMRRSPRLPDAPILSRALLWRIVLMGIIILGTSFGLYELELGLGADVVQARTVAVNVVVFVEIFYLLNCRSLKLSAFQVGLLSNRWIVLGIGGMIALQMLFTYAPFMNNVVSSAPISLLDWALVLGAGLLSYVVIEFEKWVRRRK